MNAGMDVDVTSGYGENSCMECFLIRKKGDRMQIFKGILFFKATNNTKTNNNLAAASWVLPEGQKTKTNAQTKKLVFTSMMMHCLKEELL